MIAAGEALLLLAFVSSGGASFACLTGHFAGHRGLTRAGLLAAFVALAALTAVAAILAWALWVRDFRFAYVAQYSSGSLDWHYSLSAFWAGQAGSMLLWAWLQALTAVGFRIAAHREPGPLRDLAFAILMLFVAFFVAVMVFGADPMQPDLSGATQGDGLSPSLQHPSMLLHPPVVFAGYAIWAVPCALALAALVVGSLDRAWMRQARGWSLAAWTVLGLGILWGAEWAYEELGWGGYWAWDPVENSSLIPWLTGTALIHAMLAWQYRGALKKSALLLAIATFGLCNLAAFVTRSGIFSSLHAFSRSPIGWMFLLLLAVLAAAGVAMTILHRSSLRPERPLSSLWSRESAVAVAGIALVLLAAVCLIGTLSIPLSRLLLGQRITVGAEFYNNVLMLLGTLLLAMTSVAPLLRWDAAPRAPQRRGLIACAALAAIATAVCLASGVRHPFTLAVIGLSAFTVFALVGAVLLDAQRLQDRAPWLRVLLALAANRRRYAGFLIHAGFASLAVGVAGSSLGSRSCEATLHAGQSIEWEGHTIRFVQVRQEPQTEKLIVEAELEVCRQGGSPFLLRPAQHLHTLQNEWTGKVAIHSTWQGDFYAVLHSGEGQEKIDVTLRINPMMRWLWLSGLLVSLGTLIALWPRRSNPQRSPVPPPKFLAAGRRSPAGTRLIAGSGR